MIQFRFDLHTISWTEVLTFPNGYYSPSVKASRENRTFNETQAVITDSFGKYATHISSTLDQQWYIIRISITHIERILTNKSNLKCWRLSKLEFRRWDPGPNLSIVDLPNRHFLVISASEFGVSRSQLVVPVKSAWNLYQTLWDLASSGIRR